MSESFIRFVEMDESSSGKTKIWSVMPNVQDGTWVSNLGLIKWFGRWRCYSFFPRTATAFEKKCLRDIANFCEAETTKHRERKTA